MKDWFAFILASIILLNSNYSCIPWISELSLKPGFTINFEYVECIFQTNCMNSMKAKLIKMHELLFPELFSSINIRV